MTSSKYSPIYLDSLVFFLLQNSSFNQLFTNSTGGCIYITENASNKKSTNYDRYFISSSNFTQCNALQGGAIYIDSVQGVAVGNKSLFALNNAYVSKFSSISD